MPTLSKAKSETELVLKWGGIAFGIILLIFMGIKLPGFIMSLFAPPPPPEASFGKLPPISFPDQTKETITYSLDTISGSLPTFSDRARVYRTIPHPPTLLGVDKTREKVSKVGFSFPGTQISEDTYRWENQTKSLSRTITMNIFSSDFTFSSSYLSSKTLQAFSKSDEEDNSVNAAKTFLTNMSLFPQDIDESKTKTTSYSLVNMTIVPTSKISNTKIVKVDFFQKDLSGLPIYYDKGISSSIEFWVGKENNIMEVVGARFFHNDISEIFSAYAIKTAVQAYSELQQGQAYIAYKPTNTVEFTIKNVFLGYYAGAKPQEFMMPIVIFEGNDNFLAYVSAVRDEWVSK